MIRCLLSLVLALALLSAQNGETSLDDAARALENGQPGAAVTALTAVLKTHPHDVQALMLMGVALDSLQRFQEADPYYDEALKLAPGSAPVLNNAANHWLAAGDRQRARRLFVKVLAVEPGHVNAILQLAQMSVEDKHGAEALQYLRRLPKTADNDAATALLTIQALALAGECSGLPAARERLGPEAVADPRAQFSLGTALAACHDYAGAERAFAQALDSDPGNFEVLYNLGLAALRAGDHDRAVDVLTRAAAEKPDDADTLFALAQARAARQELIEAAAVLVRARRAAPRRPDILLLLAQVSARLQFYGDAAAAYDQYLSLSPRDDEARRERGFAYARAAQAEKALADLEWYVARHPRDATGWYELAAAQAASSPPQALRSLDRALALDPGRIDARYTRAVLNLKDQHPERSIDDLRAVLQREPKNEHVLTQLGQAWLDMDRASDALVVLRQAVDVAPGDAAALLQYLRALVAVGKKDEAAAIRARLREAGITGSRHNAGLIDYLSLTPAQQRDRYTANLRSIVAADPGNQDARIRLADILLSQGSVEEALPLLRQACAAADDAATQARCGRTLLNHQQYQAALEFLTPAANRLPAARLDLAIALFHAKDAASALCELDRTAPDQRQGDFYLLRAELLDALGRVDEAAAALNEGIRSMPARPTVYLEATGFLLKRGLYSQTLKLLEQATKLLPDERELLFAQAIALELLNRGDDARRLLDRIQARWPEWDRPWLLKGMLLESQYQSAEARQALETAIALGANTPEAYYYLALAITHAAPEDAGAAQKAIEQAMSLTSTDPYVYLLAGRIALAEKNYGAAIDRLNRALGLSPRLIAAHDALRATYRAMGDETKAAAEADAMKQITDSGKPPEEVPSELGNLLFSVHAAE